MKSKSKMMYVTSCHTQRSVQGGNHLFLQLTVDPATQQRSNVCRERSDSLIATIHRELQANTAGDIRQVHYVNSLSSTYCRALTGLCSLLWCTGLSGNQFAATENTQ